MKRSVFTGLTAVLLAALIGFASFRNADSFAEKKSKKTDITGTWKLESYKYGNSSSSFTSVGPERPHIKLLTATSFQWATYDAETKKVLESAGGTYVLEGDTYTESIDFGYNMDSFLGTKSVFTIKVEDDMFFLTGKLSSGLKIEEVWQKVK